MVLFGAIPRQANTEGGPWRKRKIKNETSKKLGDEMMPRQHPIPMSSKRGKRSKRTSTSFSTKLMRCWKKTPRSSLRTMSKKAENNFATSHPTTKPCSRETGLYFIQKRGAKKQE